MRQTGGAKERGSLPLSVIPVSLARSDSPSLLSFFSSVFLFFRHKSWAVNFPRSPPPLSRPPSPPLICLTIIKVRFLWH